MQKSEPSPAKSGFEVRDILYVFFQHKGKIIGLSLLGFAAAAAVYFKQEPLYKSESKLLVRYVLQRGTPDGPSDMQQTPGRNTGKAADPIITTEIEILNSVDLAIEVAEAVGPDRLMPESDGQATAAIAAGYLLANLEVTTGQSPNVLYVFYSNKDGELSKRVLGQLVECYFKKHLAIHRSAAAFDEVTKDAAAAKEKFNKTEAELNRLRSESGIMSLADATSALTSQRIRTNEELLAARAALAEKTAALGELNQEPHENSNSDGKNSDRVSAAKLDEVPPHILTEYRSALEIIGFLQKRDMELRIKFKPGNRLLELSRQQIEANDGKRRDLEKRYPGLVAKAVALAPGMVPAENAQEKWINERASAAALRAKIEVLSAHLNEIGKQFKTEYELGSRIEAMQRRRDIEEAEYRSLDTSLKNAKVDQTLDPSRMPNITIMQKPSNPVKTFDSLTRKIILGLAGSGMALGAGLALLIELLGGRVRRPIEIQTRLQLPLMLSIPYLRGLARDRNLLADGHRPARIGGNELLELTAAHRDEMSLPPAHDGHFVDPYAETLRDRIIFNFEINNLTHRPKFVAVTGLSAGAGASTIATGLAKSLSAIEGTKVLLVDLSSPHGGMHPLYGERPPLSLAKALEANGRQDFKQAPENLYFASALARHDETGLDTFTALHLHELMPRLQASDYDFIVFDMPAIHETSRTLTMAGMMDKVLLVLDGENTSRDALTWGYSELVKGKADVSCIFNKNRTLVPSWLTGSN